MGEVFSRCTNSSEANPSKYNPITLDVLLVTILGILLVWFVQFLWGRRRLYKFASQMTGPPALPLLGNSMYFMGNSYKIFQNISNLFETYPGIFRVWLGVKLFYAVSEPKYFEILFTKCLEKERLYYKADIIVGKGLFTAEVPIWRVHRKMIAQTFNQQILDSFVEVFSEQGEIMVNILRKYSGKGEFDVFHVTSRCTLDIICETAMGVKNNAQTSHSDFGKWTDRMMEIIFLRIFVLWYQNDLFFNLSPLGKEARQLTKNMLEFTGEIVRDKKKTFELTRNANLQDGYSEGPQKRRAFLDYLLEVTNDDDAPFTEKEIQEEVNLFIIAGSDTSASTSCFVFTMLGLYQQFQEKVYNEIMEVLGPDRQPTASDLPKLKYLERFIKETLRLFPVGGVLARTINEDVDLGDCTLPAGASVVFGILRVHTNEKYWPDPYKFDPDRFLPEEVAKRHPCTYVPFSYGPRNCIGLKYAMMAMKSLIATVVRKYQIFTSYENIQDIKLTAHLVLRPKDGYKVFLQARSTNY